MDDPSYRKTKIKDDQSSSIKVKILNGYPKMTHGPQSTTSSAKNYVEQQLIDS